METDPRACLGALSPHLEASTTGAIFAYIIAIQEAQGPTLRAWGAAVAQMVLKPSAPLQLLQNELLTTVIRLELP